MARRTGAAVLPPTTDEIGEARKGLTKAFPRLSLDRDGVVVVIEAVEADHNRGLHDLSESTYADFCPVCHWATTGEDL